MARCSGLLYGELLVVGVRSGLAHREYDDKQADPGDHNNQSNDTQIHLSLPIRGIGPQRGSSSVQDSRYGKRSHRLAGLVEVWSATAQIYLHKELGIAPVPSSPGPTWVPITGPIWE